MTKKELNVGIYKIENIINNKVYIGQSKEIRQRWNRHKNEIRKGIHCNKHLERAFQSYGEENFVFEIIENCIADELDEKEQYWIAHYSSNNYSVGYNQDSGGTQGKYINKDVIARARKSRDYTTGTDNPTASFSNEEDIIEIIRMVSNRLSINYIAKEFNVGEYIINNIKNFRVYGSVKSEYDEIIKEINSTDIKLIYHNLTEVDISNIKRELASGEFYNSDIAKKYNVNESFISNIRILKYFPNIAPECNEKMDVYKPSMNSNSLDSIIVKEIKEHLLAERFNNKELSEKYEVDPSVISNIKLLKAYKHVEPQYNKGLVDMYSNCKRDSILSDDDVVSIKKQLSEKDYKSNIELANIYDVDTSIISNIKLLKSYRDVGSIYNDSLFNIHSRETYINGIIELKKYLALGIDKPFVKAEVIFDIKKDTIREIATLKNHIKVAPEYNDKLKMLYCNKIKFTSIDEVIEIKGLLILNNVSNKELAEKYNMDRSIISNIKLLKVYKDVASEYNDKLKELYGNIKSKGIISDDKIKLIKETLTLESNTNAYWGKHFSIDPSTISRIKNLKVYKDIASEYNQSLFDKYVSKNSK